MQPVDVESLKSVWQRYQQAEAERPGVRIILGADLVKKLCREGEDIVAVANRCAILRLMTKDVDLTSFPVAAQDVIFNLAATFPTTILERGRP
jgi:hypothetical protein